MARFTLPRDLYHGKGALEALKSFTGKKAMICVGGGSMKRFGFLDRAVAYLKEAGIPGICGVDTRSITQKIREKGVNEAFVTLHVGLGTFRPVKAEEVTEHHMHSELCMMNAETANMLNETKRNGGRVICVGTTSCRTLESLVNDDGTFEAKSRWTDIFIYPGYTFKAMDGLITNFHLPESTLVMLVSAFAGREHVLNAYEEAVKQRYRFFSFGDAMCIV